MNKKSVMSVALLIGLFLASCKKDQVNEKVLPGTWVVSEYKVGATDLMKDSLVTEVTGGNSIVKTKISAASFTFESDGDFTETITYGANFKYSYGSYSYSYNLPTTTESGNGIWSELDSDLNLVFNQYTSVYGYMFYESSPMNSFLITGSYYIRGLVERYNIIKMTRKEIQMEGIINNKKIYIRAEKQ